MQDIINKVKAIFKNPMLMVFILICFAFLPSAINTQSVVFRSAIVVAFGIDKDMSGNYVVNAAVNVSSVDESLSENTKLVSAKGKTVADAILSLGIQFGRDIKLGHTRFVLIGSNFAKSNVATGLDGIIRTNKMRDTVQLIMCDAKVEDVLNIGIEIKNKTGIKLSEIITYQSKFSTTSMDSNVDTFYKGYFSKSGVSKLSCITLTDDYTLGITPEVALTEATSPNAPDAGTNQSGEVQKQKKYISSTGQIAVFEKGVLKQIMPGEIASSTYWINTSFMPKKLNIVSTTPILENAKLNFQVIDKSVTSEVFFHKGIPMFSAKLDVKLGIDEIIDSSNNIIPLSTDVINKEVKCEIGRKIRQEIAQAFMFGKQHNLDVLELNEIFYLSKYKDYTNYLKTKTPQDFLFDVQLSIEISVEVI